MKSKFSARSLSEAGILIGLICVIMLFIATIPFLGVIGVYILPIPITLLYLKYDFKVSLVAVIASAIIISFITGPFSALESALLYGITGLTLGYCIKKDKAVSLTLFLLAVANLIGISLVVLISTVFIEKTALMNMIKESINTFKEIASQSLKTNNVASQNTDQIQELLDQITPQLILSYIPGFFILSSFFSAFINYITTRAILKRMRYKVKDLIPFEKVYIDNRIGAIIIILSCLGVVLKYYGVTFGTYLYNSASIVLNGAFIIIGLAVLYYFLSKRLNFPKGWAIALLVFLYFSPNLSVIIFYIGFADMILDFRKVDPNRLFKRKSAS